MYASTAIGERLIAAAIEAVQRGERGLLPALDALRAPVYVTNPDGIVTYFNKACLGFTGRHPSAGEDRWCVTWKLYTDEGEFLPHDQCPMALALRVKYPVRGLSAVAERPDGSRVNFLASPTPIFGKDGDLLGAVNLLIDITDLKEIDRLRIHARRCRRLALDADDATAETLRAMAAECEAKADGIAEVGRAWPLVLSLVDHDEAAAMPPIMIRKKAERFFYVPGSGKRVTFNGLAELAFKGVDFVVLKDEGDEDITRAVLLQIALAQKAGGRPLLSAKFLRQLIRLSHDNVGALASLYLEFSLFQFERRSRGARDPPPALPDAAQDQEATSLADLWRRLPEDRRGDARPQEA